MDTYETYETNEDREKELSDAKHKGYLEGRDKAHKEWQLSQTRWERFRNSIITVAISLSLLALTFLWIVPAAQDNMSWNESLRVWKADCVARGGTVIDPGVASNQTGKYICIIGKVDSTK